MADRMNKGGPSRGRAVRIMCLILVILMLLGTVSTIIMFMFAYAPAASAASYSEPLMRIGLCYGDSAAKSFRTYSGTGHTLVIQNPAGDCSSTIIGDLLDKTLVVAPSGNLATSGTGFAIASSGVTVGGFRLEVSDTYTTYSTASGVASTVAAAVASLGYQAFPAYVGGSFKVRIGCFPDVNAANTAISAVQAAAKVTVNAVSPSVNGVTVLTTDAKVRFEFDNGTVNNLGLRPIGAGELYLRADDNSLYEGTIMYKHTGDRITVINILGLETYVEGVLPYEISSSWHIEAQKAFAIAARSYAMGNINKHNKSYGFDLCNGTNCQVYKGVDGITDRVREAVAATEGKILMYNGKIATLYYSSSTGGCTVSAYDCWGGTGAPFLTGVQTPWERYANYGNGLWTTEVSPTELCEYLRGKGYTTLTGAVASIEIVSNASNSDYVKSLKITDTSGHFITLNNTDNVRIGLSKYLKSANFVVGKGSVAYTVAKVEASSEKMPYNSQSMSNFGVMTAAGKLTAALTGGAKVSTGKGVVTSSDYEYVITASNYKGGGDTVNGYKTTYENRTVTASSSGNFVFAGKGWGHGVGLSQYGTKDLAEFGYSYDRILASYVPSVQIKHVSDLG